MNATYLRIMPKVLRSAGGRGAQLFSLGLIAGVAASAILFPAAALGGVGVKLVTGLIDRLPHELRVAPPAQTTYVYAADGKTLITMFYEEHRRYTAIDQMSPYIQHA